MGSAIQGSVMVSRLRGTTVQQFQRSRWNPICRCYNGHKGNGDGRIPPQDALLRALSEISKADGRTSQKINAVMGGPVGDEQWKALDEKVNLYPMVRRFIAIGNGGDDFARAMVVAVESVVLSPIPAAWVTKRLSARGKYISVKIGPVLVNSSDEVKAVYNAMKRDRRMKYFF